MAQIVTAKNVDVLFTLFDYDGDGTLSQKELVDMIKVLKASEDVDPSEIIKAWDYDGDGKVDLTAFDGF